MIPFPSFMATFGTASFMRATAGSPSAPEDFAAVMASLGTTPTPFQATPVLAPAETPPIDLPEVSAAPLLAAMEALAPAARSSLVETDRFSSREPENSVKIPSPDWIRPPVIALPQVVEGELTSNKAAPTLANSRAELPDEDDGEVSALPEVEAPPLPAALNDIVVALVQQPDVPLASTVLSGLRSAERPVMKAAIADHARAPIALPSFVVAGAAREASTAADSDAPLPTSPIDAAQVAIPGPSPLESAPFDRRAGVETGLGTTAKLDVLAEGVEAQIHELDALVRDISEVSGKTGRAAFRLAAEQLGGLEVRLHTSDTGVAVAIRADSEQGHTVVSQAQRQLSEDLRANGLRVAETSVSLGQNGADRDRSDRSAPHVLPPPIEAAVPGATDAIPADEQRPTGRYA